jgi:hypothetical protein
VPCHRPYPDHPVCRLDLSEARNAIEVDDRSRGGEAKVHHRNEALTAGEHPRLALVSSQDRQGFIDRGGAMVVEFRRFHAAELTRSASLNAIVTRIGLSVLALEADPK